MAKKKKRGPGRPPKPKKPGPKPAPRPPGRPRKPPKPPPPPPDPPPIGPVGHGGPDELSDDEARFVAEYLVDRVAAHAYRRVHPNCTHETARAAGLHMRRRPRVAREIAAALDAQNRRVRVSADRALKEIARIAFSDILDYYNPVTQNLYTPRQIPLDARRAIASIRVLRSVTVVTRNGRDTRTVTEQEVEYKLWNKLDALEKLCRHLGINTSIPPLEALLAMFPPALSAAIRQAMATPADAAPHVIPAPSPPPLDDGEDR